MGQAQESDRVSHGILTASQLWTSGPSEQYVVLCWRGQKTEDILAKGIISSGRDWGCDSDIWVRPEEGVPRPKAQRGHRVRSKKEHMWKTKSMSKSPHVGTERHGDRKSNAAGHGTFTLKQAGLPKYLHKVLTVGGQGWAELKALRWAWAWLLGTW